MNEELKSAYASLANSPAWELVSEELLSRAKDISYPDTEYAKELTKANPAAAYIGKVFSSLILEDLVNLVSVYKVRENGKPERFD